MKLIALHLEGFGKLVDCSLAFDPQLNVVYGPNEAGKSTLANAIVAMLYGVARREEREAWRPWNGAPFAGRLEYELADGRAFEVERNFEREPKGTRVRDRNGNDVSGDVAVSKVVAPGAVHLGIPLEVFVNATCVRQGSAEIDGSRAEAIGSSLAHALDGGPREDAALGALATLDQALVAHVGAKRARVNAPLRHLETHLSETLEKAGEVRLHLRALDDMRVARERSLAAAAALHERRLEHERSARNLRAAILRDRIDALRTLRDNVASLAGEGAAYDDVANFPSERVAELQAAHARWEACEAAALQDERAALDARLTPALQSELEERAADGGALDDAAFAALSARAKSGEQARAAATFAASQANAALRVAESGAGVLGAAGATALLVALAAIALAIVHAWYPAIAAAAVAVFCAVFVMSRRQQRREARARADRLRKEADDATSAETKAAKAVADVLERLGVASLEELTRRRLRAQELRARKERAVEAAARARQARLTATTAARAFDELAALLGETTGTRDEQLRAAKRCAARKLARDGLDLQLQMLHVRRADVLAGDDEVELERELAALLAAGSVPARLANGGTERAFAAQRDDLERRERQADTDAATIAATLAEAERRSGDLAALDEEAVRTESDIARLVAFARAVTLARDLIDQRTREAHERFARRLEDYAARTLERVTGGRYADVRVDPTTLQIRLRAPETGSICDLSQLSAGTREQAYLLVRLAMARMFAEGAERLPLLLDDPFAYWDAQRVERGLPLLQAAAAESQVIVFTASAALADAAAARGARRIDLKEPSLASL